MNFLLLILILIFILLGIFFFQGISRKEKQLISFSLLFITGGALFYNHVSDIESNRVSNIVTKFKQNKNIQCGINEVNQSNYSLSIGTYTFIGKKETPYYGNMISLFHCK